VEKLWSHKYDEIPVFVKAGSVIPKYPVQQYVEGLEFDELTLDLYYKEGKREISSCKMLKDGYDYKKGRYSFLSFQVTGKRNLFNCTKKVNDTPYSKYKINLIGLPFKVTSIELTMKSCHRY
jgi:alpha-glucosidase